MVISTKLGHIYEIEGCRLCGAPIIFVVAFNRLVGKYAVTQ